MDSASIGIPFLDELRRKWQDGTLPAGQALNQLTLWEDNASQRTGEELDAAWTLRGEIEAASSGAMNTPPPPDANPQVETTTTATPPQTPTPPSSPPAQPGQGEQAYNLIPRLRDLSTQAAAARSRRDWGQIDTLRTEAENLIAQYASAGGAPLTMPGDLEATFAKAAEAQEAERLMGEAQAVRRKGDFSEAAYRLAEAARLDPRYTPLSAAQQLVSDLQRSMRDLRDNPLNSAEELADARRLARRLSEEDAAPESEYVTKKLADVEAEINRRVDASKQYVDADLATIEEPGSLDDKMQALGRLGTEVSKIETLRPDAPYLPDTRSRYIAAKRQIERLKLDRDNLLPEIGNLDPQKGFDVARLGSIVQRLEALTTAPLAKGDSSIDTAAQNLGHRLNSYLSSRLPTEQTGAPALQEYEQVLALAQRGSHPLSPQQVSTFSAAIQKARSGSQPSAATSTSAFGSTSPGATSPGSTRPSSTPPGLAPRPGSIPPAPRVGSNPPPGRGTMPIPGGSMPVAPPMQGPSQFGTMPPPQSGAGQYNPIYVPPVSGWTPPPAVIVTQDTSSRGVPVWAWLLPLLVVLAVGGYFGWSAYQGAEKDKQVHAQATATAQAESTAAAIAHATELTQDAETAVAIVVADSTSTAQANAQATADAQATETAAADQAAANQTATALANNSANATGNIEQVTVDYDITQGGLKGMLIHVKFTVDNVKDVQCQASAYFYYNTGDKIKDTDGTFAATDGQVAVSTKFQPGFDSTVYDDLQIFMPYSQIDVAPGAKYNLRFQVQAYILSPYKVLASSQFVDFTMTK